jgi:hypothetical protein
MGADQNIIEETGTSYLGDPDKTLEKALNRTGMGSVKVEGSIDHKAHNLTKRLNQIFTSTTESLTDAASQEKYKIKDVDGTEYPDFMIPPEFSGPGASDVGKPKRESK